MQSLGEELKEEGSKSNIKFETYSKPMLAAAQLGVRQA